MVWLLPTRGRPAQCQEVLDACERMGMTSRGLVFVDGPTSPDNNQAYADLRLPGNWDYYFSSEHVCLSASMQWCFHHNLSERNYGWLADDMIPRTVGFDRQLEEAAGIWEYAQCDDGWLRPEYDKRVIDYKRGSLLSAGLCWGGNLVRAVGWWGWPKVRQAGIDGMWGRIIHLLGYCHYLDDVMIDHRTWRCGKRAKDDTDVIDPTILVNDMTFYKAHRKKTALKAVNDVVGMRTSIAKAVEKYGNLSPIR